MNNARMPDSRDRFVTAIVLAGGSGTRLGADTPKQYLHVGDGMMLVHPLKVFETCPVIDAAILVLPKGDALQEPLPGDLEKLIAQAEGGPTRQSSLAEGLIDLPDLTDVVLVHDAARPAVSAELVTRVLDGLEEGFQGCVPVIPMEDAIKEVSLNNELVRGVPKVGLYRAQTPQAFLREPLEDSLARCDADSFVAEDCSDMLLRSGYKVNTVEGDALNIKVTTLRDLALCESILGSRRARESKR